MLDLIYISINYMKHFVSKKPGLSIFLYVDKIEVLIVFRTFSPQGGIIKILIE